MKRHRWQLKFMTVNGWKFFLETDSSMPRSFSDHTFSLQIMKYLFAPCTCTSNQLAVRELGFVLSCWHSVPLFWIFQSLVKPELFFPSFYSSWISEVYHWWLIFKVISFHCLFEFAFLMMTIFRMYVSIFWFMRNYCLGRVTMPRLTSPLDVL